MNDTATDPLEVLAETSAEAQRMLDERDMAVIRAFAAGASLRRIGEAAGLTHVGVKKLVDRLAPDFVVTDENGRVMTVVEAKRRALTSEEKRAYNIELNKRRKGDTSGS